MHAGPRKKTVRAPESARLFRRVGFAGIAAAFLCGPLWSQTAAVGSLPVVTLKAGQTLTLPVRPRELQTLTLTVEPGRYNEFRMDLPGSGVRGSYVKVVPQAAAGGVAADPVISDSGETFVRLPLSSETAGQVTLQVTVLTNSKADNAVVETQVSLRTSELSVETQGLVKALTAFDHAEKLRRSHTGVEEARASYAEALGDARQIKDSVLEQRILLSAGRMLMLDGKHYAEAIAMERQAVAVKGTDAAPSVQALAWKMLGGALMNTGEYAESLTASGRALALYEKTGETYWQGIVLENMGGAALNLGDLKQALATNERALKLSRELHDDYGVVEMLAEIGAVHRSRGEYQEALNDFSEAVEVALPSTFNPMQGEAWLALGRLHRELGEEDHAAEDFGKALEIAQHTSNALDELDAIQSMGRLSLDRGQVGAAVEQFSRGFARARELKVVRPESALLIGLGESSRALGKTDEARRWLEQAVDVSGGIHQTSETADALSQLGAMAEVAGKNVDAAQDFTRALTLYDAIPDKAGIAQVDTSLARLEARTGHEEDALRHLHAAMEIIESSRASFARGGLRTRFFAGQRATYDQAVGLLMKLDQERPQAGYAAQAWRVAERARARSLLDELSAAKGGDKADEALKLRLAALGARITTLEDTVAQSGTKASDLEATAKIDAELRRVVLEADELESRLLRGEAVGGVKVAELTPAGFAAEVLGRNDALVEYWTGTDASYGWLITSDGRCMGFTLPGSGRLERLVKGYRDALLARDLSPEAETLRGREARLQGADAEAKLMAGTLGSALLPKEVRQRLGEVQRLVVVPDGPMAQLPFGALRLAGEGKQGEYLLERFELVSEPSAAFLTVKAEGVVSKPAMRVAIFADPVYNLADTRLASLHRQAMPVSLKTSQRGAGSVTDLSHLPRLPGSRQEAMAIAGIVGVEKAALFLGFDATPAAVHSLEWPRYPVAHFAVHAISRSAGPDSAGILLSMRDAQGHAKDGALWLRDINEWHIARELVVLSGCETALGETVPGEGMNSLARGFLFSGTRQVAATLWSADDASMSSLMVDFYQGMVHHDLGAAGALREAQLTLMKKPRYAAPYYWAGFIAEGHWKTH